MTALHDLARKWEDEAKQAERYGDDRGATIARLHASELRELLDPQQAAEASGYSRRTLRSLTASGKLTNYGRPGAPRFRRSDLPTKSRPADGFDASAAARELCAS